MNGVRGTLAVVFVVGLLGAAPPAAAASGHDDQQIEVFPGTNTLSQALAQAHPGDALELHTGTFVDAVTISTPTITIESAGDGPVTIDARCSAFQTIEITADGVTIQGDITVAGGIFYEINDIGVRSGILVGLTLKDTCRDGVFGVEIQHAGALFVSSNRMTGFGGAGINVDGVTDTGGSRMLIASNDVVASGRGITVSSSRGGRIELTGNRLRGDTFSGINLVSSDGVVIRGNTARNDGTYGIQLDSNSDANLVGGNSAFGNTFDLSNSGTGNCFKANRYRTSEGEIGC
jgi:parallel beta-helix repeat protein